MKQTDEAQNRLVIKSLNTEVGLWRLKVDQLQAENKRLNIIIDNRAEDLEVKTKYEKSQAKNERLKEIIEAAISQHHRVGPNTVVDILIREYEAL